MAVQSLPVRIATPPPTVTVAVLTKNNASRIENCLRSAAFADQIVVVDSGSTDSTVERARTLGAEVWVHDDWQGFAVQRNRLLAHANGDYVFFLDADEVITPALQEEIRVNVRSGSRAVWRIQWRMVVFGHELKFFRSQSKVERLFRRDMLREYVGAVHERAVLHPAPGDGHVPRHLMRAKLLHYSRDTVRGSMEKMTQYAMLGAAKRAAQGQHGGVLRGLVSAASMFIRLYVFHLGFLCGGPGFVHCLFVSAEGFFRYVALDYDRESLTSDIPR